MDSNHIVHNKNNSFPVELNKVNCQFGMDET